MWLLNLATPTFICGLVMNSMDRQRCVSGETRTITLTRHICISQWVDWSVWRNFKLSIEVHDCNIIYHFKVSWLRHLSSFQRLMRWRSLITHFLSNIYSQQHNISCNHYRIFTHTNLLLHIIIFTRSIKSRTLNFILMTNKTSFMPTSRHIARNYCPLLIKKYILSVAH